MDRDIRATFTDTSVATWLLLDEAHGSKNALLVFMDLSDTNYKFMDPKMHFRVYRPMFSKFMDLTDTNYKLMDLKMHFWSSWT